MKKNLPVNAKEYTFQNETPLISTTDLKGQITFVNDAFVEISGFSRDELIGSPHNMVRHPDVPPVVFADMWSKLKANKPWIGVVKNRCKDGGYYWVNAYVTPIVEHGQTLGYQSVRTLPTASQKKRAQAVYDRINQNKARFSFHDVSINTKVSLLPWFAALLPILALYFSGEAVIVPSIVAIAGAAICSGLALYSMKPIRMLVSRSHEVIQSQVLEEMYANSVSEAGSIYLAALTNKARIRSANVRVSHSARALDSQGRETIDIAHQAEAAITRQVQDLEKISQSINEFTAAIEEVAQSANDASANTQEANEKARAGKDAVSETIQAISGLDSNVRQAAKQLELLQAATDEIHNATQVISEIADQTNLLALNAAIEAARAGDQGRGFAVVADEVRALAQRTQQSTRDIDEAINRLSEESGQVISVMEKGQQQAATCVDKANYAGAALEDIRGRVEVIANMNAMMASASSAQSHAAEALMIDIESVKQSAEVALEASRNTEKASIGLAKTSREIIQSVNI